LHRRYCRRKRRKLRRKDIKAAYQMNEILKRRLQGKTIEEIMQELALERKQVVDALARLKRCVGKETRAKLDRPFELALRDVKIAYRRNTIFDFRIKRGMSEREIARALNIPHSTVHSDLEALSRCVGKETALKLRGHGRVAKDTVKVMRRRKQLLEILVQSESITREQIAKKLGVSKATISRDLQAIRKQLFEELASKLLTLAKARAVSNQNI
jgi:DNA-binding CsgD family transcriptional regulator